MSDLDNMILDPESRGASRRAEAGNRARLEGQSFEDALDWMHRRYESEGRAIILQAGTKARARKMPNGELRFIAGPSLPDYIGWVRLSVGEPPRAVVFDAKTTSDAVGWSLPKKSAHQAEFLSRLAGIGAVAFFLVECRPRRTCYVIRVRETPSWPLARFHFDEMRHAAITDDGSNHYDWLMSLEEWGWLE